MANKTKLTTRRITACAVCAALGSVIMTLGSIVEVLDLSTAALASMLLIFAVIEIGGPWPWLTYAATGLLSLLLPLKTAAIFYILAGYYPLVKEKLERIRSRVLTWIIKLLGFNAVLIICYIIVKHILLLPDTFDGLSWLAIPIANITFILYDIALTRIISYYILILRHKLRIDRMELR